MLKEQGFSLFLKMDLVNALLLLNIKYKDVEEAESKLCQ